MSTIIAIADAMVACLNGAGVGLFSKPFVAVRHYKPTFDLQDMKTLHVTVVPRGVELSTATRAAAQADVQVDIGVQQKLPPSGAPGSGGDTAELDALMHLVEEIADYFRSHRLAACPNVLWVKTENTPIYSPEHLEIGRLPSKKLCA